MPSLKTEDYMNDDSDVTCVTHTGSTLIVSPSEQAVKIATTTGDELNFIILDKKKITVGAEPGLKYSLDDGRKLVTTFVAGHTIGHGYYIRNNGILSPTFECLRN